MHSSWLRRKLDRTRRLEEHWEYIHNYAREITATTGGLLIDLGPGAGELLEFARYFGHKAVGVDATPGTYSMGSKYHRACQMMWQRQQLIVHCVGAIRWCQAHQLTYPGSVMFINSRGSLAQIFADHLLGPAHELHHNSKLLSWPVDDDALSVAMSQFLSTIYDILSPRGCFLIHDNEPGNPVEFDQWLDELAAQAGFTTSLRDKCLHKLHKAEP